VQIWIVVTAESSCGQVVALISYLRRVHQLIPDGFVRSRLNAHSILGLLRISSPCQVAAVARRSFPSIPSHACEARQRQCLFETAINHEAVRMHVRSISRHSGPRWHLVGPTQHHFWPGDGMRLLRSTNVQATYMFGADTVLAALCGVYAY